MRKPKPIQFIINNNNCFVVISHSKIQGYPRFTRNKKRYRISRYIYEQCFGGIPPGMEVCHTCDNPACINPEHFFLGTHKDNMQDRTAKNRQARGESHGRSKLKEEEVIAIRGSTLSRSALMRKYKVSYNTIKDIQNFKKWRDT